MMHTVLECQPGTDAGNNYARESPRACVGAYIVTKHLWPESFPQSLRDLDSLKTYIRPSRRCHEALLVPRRRGAVSADATGRLLCAATRELLEEACHTSIDSYLSEHLGQRIRNALISAGPAIDVLRKTKDLEKDDWKRVLDLAKKDLHENIDMRSN
ncbi:hypothetical protein EVAR_37856_1 [Eumeta japonica]|uniref:Uncharacterized protein n=1 Tax=Eumeta variegata TaxID=151549 RepID=A0A4C1X4E6_EUMVA|nr:hypothetical protein EVAR_37856_1 [Eumeta japonica]